LSETELVCTELGREIDRLKGDGFRLDLIYPADEPHTAVLSKGGETIRVTTRPGEGLGGELPPFEPKFVLTKAGGGSGEGRAGMLYRDLIPSRLGGRYIASHISIPDGGPVSDWVHYHDVRFQIIYVRKGWVRVVYEDQGEPFVMEAGDLVLQPPEIRHRVLESSAGLEVVEISCPAAHPTYADHDLDLPNTSGDASRRWSGQLFLMHVAAKTPWTRFGGGEAQETGIGHATDGFADVRTIRSGGDALRFDAHDGELVFGFVLDGSAMLDCRGAHSLRPADSFVVPPGVAFAITDASPDFRLLHVTTARADWKSGLAASGSSPL
jgi:quercetin dioxygenase-like cupin family protein